MKNTKTFLELVKENPNLKIIPLVYSEVVCDDSYNTWIGSFGNAYLDEICYPTDTDRPYFKSDIDDLSEYYIDKYDDYPEYSDMKDEEFWKAMELKAKNQNWEKVIVVYIDLPEV